MSIARKSALGFVGQVYMLAIGLLSTILVARLLGPEGKGVLAVVAAIPSLALGVASFGLGPALGYMSGKDHYPARELATAATVWSVVLGCVLGLLLWAFRGLLLTSVLKGLNERELAFVIVSLPTYYIVAFLGALFVGHGRAVALAAIQSLSATLNFSAVVLASVIAPGDSTLMVILLAIASGLGAVASLMVYGAGFDWAPRKVVEITKAATPYAAKSYVGQASSMFFLRADVFFLNYFAGPSAVGVYSVATNLAEKLWLLSTPVASAVFSQITGTDRDDAVRLTTLTSRMLLLMNGIAGAALILLSIAFVPLVYGVQFSAAVGYLAILIPGVVLFAVCQPYIQFFTGQLGRPGISSVISGAMMVFSAALYAILIPVMGATGAALGSTLSYSSALVGYGWLMPRVADVRLRQMLVPTRSDIRLLRSLVDSVVARVRRRGADR